MVSSMSDSEGGDQLAESVEELRLRLEAMKRMMENDQDESGKGKEFFRRRKHCKESVIDASFLSFVFLAVLLIIVCVSFHAFQNLYYAVLKKFHAREHTEL